MAVSFLLPFGHCFPSCTIKHCVYIVVHSTDDQNCLLCSTYVWASLYKTIAVNACYNLSKNSITNQCSTINTQEGNQQQLSILH